MGNYNELPISKNFLIVPNPEKNEFIISFLVRLKKLNAYPSLNSIIKTIFDKNINLSLLIKGEFGGLEIAQFTNLTIDDVNNMRINSKEFYETINVILCPICIQFKKYISLECYNSNTICPIHLIPYTNKCLNCGEIISWDANDFEICHYCKKPVSTNFFKYLIPIESFKDFSVIFFIYKNLLNYNPYSYGGISLRNINNYVIGLNNSIEFLNNPEKHIIKHIREIFFYFTKRYENTKVIYNEIIIYIFKILNLINLYKNIDINIRNTLSDIIGEHAISEILIDYQNNYFKYCLNGAQIYYKSEKTLTLTHTGVMKILNINYDFLLLVLEIFEISYDENFIDIYNFVIFMKKILRRVDQIEYSDKYVYFNGLAQECKRKILENNIILFYNFNYDNGLYNIKIKEKDLKKL